MAERNSTLASGTAGVTPRVTTDVVADSHWGPPPSRVFLISRAQKGAEGQGPTKGHSLNFSARVNCTGCTGAGEDGRAEAGSVRTGSALAPLHEDGVLRVEVRSTNLGCNLT